MQSSNSCQECSLNKRLQISHLKQATRSLLSGDHPLLVRSYFAFSSAVNTRGCPVQGSVIISAGIATEQECMIGPAKPTTHPSESVIIDMGLFPLSYCSRI